MGVVAPRERIIIIIIIIINTTRLSWEITLHVAYNLETEQLQYCIAHKHGLLQAPYITVNIVNEINNNNSNDNKTYSCS